MKANTSTQTLAVRLRPETHARLKALAEAQHTTMDWIISQLLDAKEHPTKVP